MPEPSSNSPASRPKFYRSRIVRLRQGLAVVLLLVVAVVLLFWWRGRGTGSAPRIAPVGLTIRQSAQGFTLARSEGGRPVFMVHADRAVQLKQGSQARLTNVRIELYNRDGKRANEIYGQEFGYDPASGTVTAEGKVHIDLGGVPGQTATGAEENGRHVHIETNDLVFNVRSGTGEVSHGLSFHYLGAQGTAGGAQLSTHPNLLTLTHQVQMQWSRSDGPPVNLAGATARLDEQASLIQIDGNATIRTGPQQVSADRFQFLLRHDYSIRQAIAIGHVQASQVEPQRKVVAQADQGNAVFAEPAQKKKRAEAHPGQGMQLVTLQMNGHARMQETAPRQSNALSGGMITLRFDPSGRLSTVEARQNARLQMDSSGGPRSASTPAALGGLGQMPLAGGPGTRTISAPGLDFLFSSQSGKETVRLVRMQTVGRGRLNVTQPGSWMTADADQMNVGFDAQQHPAGAEATGNVMVREQPTPVGGKAQPVRTSASDRLQLLFAPGRNQVQLAKQNGQVRLQEADRQVRADHLEFDPRSGLVQLSAEPGSGFTRGSVAGEDATVRFRAPHVQMNQRSGQLLGWGGVQVSFLSSAGAKAAGDGSGAEGAMFNSRAPIDVTADRMDVMEKAGRGTFQGHVRLWQGKNLTLADRMKFDRPRGQLDADGHVTSTFVQAEGKTGQPRGGLAPGLGTGLVAKSAARSGPVPIAVTASRLTYSDTKRQGQYTGNVILISPQARMTARELQIFLAPAGTSPVAQLDRVVASGGVSITQPGRRATAQQVVYDLTRNLITMRGGPPSIYDAEHGYLTGEILTFSPSNDTIRLESQPGTRTFGEYRVRH